MEKSPAFTLEFCLTLRIRGIREKTITGRPLGTDDFVERLEKQLKRFFNLKPKGRPKKKVDK